MAAYHGTLLPNTSPQELAHCQADYDYSALHVAASYNHLPANTSVHDLLAYQGAYENPLNQAAANGNLPKDTTAQHLANCLDTERDTALHKAAHTGCLPFDTTTGILQTTLNRQEVSAWSKFHDFVVLHPERAIHCPPHLFETVPKLAINAVNEAIKIQPQIANSATIWLGHILAGTTHSPAFANAENKACK